MAWSIFSNPGGGVTPASWARSLLSAIGAPRTPANVQSIIAWELHEGGGGTYNPLNTTMGASGASDFNSVGVKNYTSYQEGVQATARTLQGSYYTSIVQALKSGHGLGTGSYAGLSTWSGGGYDNMAGTWDQAAHYMSGKGTMIKGGTPISVMSATKSGGAGSSAASGVSGTLSAAGGILHGSALMLDRFLALGAPGQGWRFVFGAGMVAAGYGAYRAYTSGDGEGGHLPLAIALTGVASVCAFLTLRQWPQTSNGAIKPGAYVVDVIEGKPPPAGPQSVSPTEVTLTETALGGLLTLWAAAKAARVVSAGTSALGGLLGAAGIGAGAKGGSAGETGGTGGEGPPVEIPEVP